jgi:hypothetical protein
MKAYGRVDVPLFSAEFNYERVKFYLHSAPLPLTLSLSLSLSLSLYIYIYIYIYIYWGVGIAMGYGLDYPGSVPGSSKTFLFSTACRPPRRPRRSPIYWVPGALYPEVKRQGREADHLPPSSAEVKNGGAIPPLLHMSSWHSAQLIKHTDNFTSFTYSLALTSWAKLSVYYSKCKLIKVWRHTFQVDPRSKLWLRVVSSLKFELLCSCWVYNKRIVPQIQST